MSAVKDKQGNTYTDKIEVLEWGEGRTLTHLNTAIPHQPTIIDEIIAPKEEADDLPSISLEEIEQAVKKMKNQKAPGIDSITAEVLKAGGKPMTEMRTPKDWAHMPVTPIHK